MCGANAKAKDQYREHIKDRKTEFTEKLGLM